MRFFVVILILFLAACDEPVKTRALGEPTWQSMTLSGSKSGSCYQCGLTYTGKYSCSFALRHNCSCSYTADVLVQKSETTWESGEVTRASTIIEQKNESECK